MQPVDAVLFDLHTTLVDGGDAQVWLEQAAAEAGAPAPNRSENWIAVLDDIWVYANRIDPGARRDLAPDIHHRVFLDLIDLCGKELGDPLDPRLTQALYDTMLSQWVPYADAAGVLGALQAGGIATVLVSNVGIDVRPVLRAGRLDSLIDAVVLSYEVGAVKPDPEIFSAALRAVDTDPERALMVGDSHGPDGGASSIGIRTLLLPRTRGPQRGLDIVCRMAGVPSPGDQT